MWASPIALAEAEQKVRPLLLLGLEPRLHIEVASGLLARLSLAAAWFAVRPTWTWRIDGEGTHRARGQAFVVLGRLGVMVSVL